MTMNNDWNAGYGYPQQTDKAQSWLSSVLTPENIELLVRLGVEIGPGLISLVGTMMSKKHSARWRPF